MDEKTRKGPSLAAISCLLTLAVSLWMEVELSSALFRAVLVYLGLSLVLLVYRVILGHYLVISERKAREELLEKARREAEAELARQKEKEAKGAKAAPRQKAPAEA
ncbi:MAG: hypothetical protein C4524_01555 [Candidatus Zixiibacteriota bacterium]|nr:MAG: hypothetical protein C4524_01555 [candidate division Zixibacteria bacterium]